MPPFDRLLRDTHTLSPTTAQRPGVLDSLPPFMHSMLDRAGHMRRQPVRGYAFAFLSFVLAFIVRWFMDDYLSAGFPFLTFFPAIVLTAFFGGRGPGALCSVLSILAAWTVFIPPRWSFQLNSQAIVAIGFFVLISVVDVFVIDLMTRAVKMLSIEQERSNALLEQQTTLYHELQHRVANNMQMVSTMMASQQKTLQHNAEAVDALKAARQRFELMARIHRRLHDPRNALLPLAEMLPDLCNDYVKAMDAPHVQCVVHSDDVKLNTDQSITLSLIVIEVITNSLKHAFAHGQAGRIAVTVQALDGQHARLTIADDGAGLPPGTDLANSDRLGMRILRGLAQSLGGTLTVDTGLDGQGTGVTVDFPLPKPQAPAN